MKLGPLAPYASALKLGAVVAVLLAAFTGGCQVQRSIDAGERERLRGALRTSGTQLEAAAAALRSSGNALALVNAETERRLQAAERMRAAAVDSGNVAAQERDAAERNAAAADRRWRDAADRRADCAALQQMSLEAACGLSPR